MRPSILVACSVWLARFPVTWSTTVSAPSPFVASRTWLTHFGSLVSTARCAPNSPSRARRSALVEEPMTSAAPFSRAICNPIRPTPELAPRIRTLLPGPASPCVTTASCMVCSATGRVAASSKRMPWGMSCTRPWSTDTYSAKAAAPEPITRSPAFRPVTAAPVSEISPAHSSPSTAPAPPAPPWMTPRAMARSARLSAAARTRTSTSSGPGCGTGTSASSGPSAPRMCAFIGLLSPASVHRSPSGGSLRSTVSPPASARRAPPSDAPWCRHCRRRPRALRAVRPRTGSHAG